MKNRDADASRRCARCNRPLERGQGFELCPACLFDFPESAVSASEEGPGDDSNSQEALPGKAGAKPKRAPTTIADTSLAPFDGGPPPPPPKPSHAGESRFWRWPIAVLYALLVAGAIFRMIWVERQTREPLDLTYMLTSGEYSVGNVLRGCEPPFPAPSALAWYAVRDLPAFELAESGALVLAPDDRLSPIVGDDPLRAVNGIAISEASADEFLDANPLDRNRWLTLGTDADANEVAFFRVMMPNQWVRLLAGLGVGTLGVLAYWVRPGRKSSAGFLIACLWVALFWYTRSIPFYLRIGIEDFLYHVLQVYLAVPYAVFVVTFTPLRLVVVHPLYAGIAAALPATAIFVSNAVISPFAMMHGYLVRPMFRLWAVYMIVLLLVTIPVGLWCRVRNIQLTPTDKARGRVVVLGIALSFAPLIVFSLLDYDASSTFSLRLIPEAGVLLFPIVITYAILRHNLLRISELLRDGLVYTIFSLGLLGLYAAVAASATAVFASVTTAYIQALAMAGTVLVAIPSHNIVRRTISRRLEIPPEEFDDLLHHLDEIAKSAPSPDGYCRDVVHFLERVTKTDRVSILVREPGDLDWKISDSQHGTGLTPLNPTCTPLIHELESKKSDLFLDDFLDDFAAPRRQDTPLQSLHTLEANAVLPLSARNQLVGALALGRRVDQRNHSARELKLYKRLGGHIANALVYMFDRLRSASGNRIVDIYPDYPKRIGNFTIDRVLGEGGMSYVYLGHNSLGFAAVKVCNRFVQSDRKLLERFHREGLALSKIKHGNIVPILDVGWEGPEPFMAMEYFQRGSLEDVIEREGPRSEKTAMRYLVEAVRGLDAALKSGVIHRDIKPTNLFVTVDDSIKIGDFGLARLADQTTLTREGEVFGTPHFMSPEILRGQAADWTADQYALGVSLYFVLTGQLPFEGENVESLHFQHAHTPVPDVRAIRPDLSEKCSQVIARMVAKLPSERFSSYPEIARAVG